MRKPVITVIGSFVVGMTMRTNRMPVFGESLIGTDLDIGPGGKGSNQAVGAARLGADVHFAGIIGQDNLGEIALDLYHTENIHTRRLIRVPNFSTGVAFIILNQKGENGIVVGPSANLLMDDLFVDQSESEIAASDIVMSVLEIPAAAAARAMELGRKHRVRTLLNPAPAVELPDSIFPNVDILTPNETELRILLSLSPDDSTPTEKLARRLQERGVKNLVVTCGERGALVLTPQNVWKVPPVRVEVVDSTGAGDAFNAALAVALAEGRELVEAVRYANCAGAYCCTRLGVIPGLGSREEIDRIFAGLPKW